MFLLSPLLLPLLALMGAASPAGTSGTTSVWHRAQVSQHQLAAAVTSKSYQVLDEILCAILATHTPWCHLFTHEGNTCVLYDMVVDNLDVPPPEDTATPCMTRHRNKPKDDEGTPPTTPTTPPPPPPPPPETSLIATTPVTTPPTAPTLVTTPPTAPTLVTTPPVTTPPTATPPVTTPPTATPPITTPPTATPPTATPPVTTPPTATPPPTATTPLTTPPTRTTPVTTPPATAPPTATPSVTTVSSTCDAPFSMVSMGCVHLYKKMKTWDKARLYCEDLEAELAVVPPESYSKLQEFLVAYGSSEKVWVGVKEGKWMDGREVSTAEWCPKETDRDPSGCGFMKLEEDTYLLHDHRCGRVAVPNLRRALVRVARSAVDLQPSLLTNTDHTHSRLSKLDFQPLHQGVNEIQRPQ